MMVQEMAQDKLYMIGGSEASVELERPFFNGRGGE